MKVAAALVLLAAHCLARPDTVGVERKYESPSEAPGHQFSNDADSSVLPASSYSREGKEAYTEGEMIPVQLIYGPDHETEATVKEVSVESMMRSNQGDGKRRNRVSRSSDKMSNSDMYADTFGGEHDSKPKNFWSWLTEDAGSFGSHPEEVNQALGIQARGVNERSRFGSNLNDFLGKLDVNPSPDDTKQGIRRRIQHFQTFMVPIYTGLSVPMPVENIPMGLPQSGELFDEPLRHEALAPAMPLPFLPPAPYNALWSTFTNIIEYGQETSKKEGKSRRKRDSPVHNYEELFVEDLARSGAPGPHITKLKVRRGGVAIAGPGGIATAGSGGTAIVGPGGTAYTTQDGTAVVGPGGRVVELPPGSSITEIVRSRSGENDETSSNVIVLPPGAKIVATGPVVYYKGLLPFLHAPVPPPIVERL